MSARQHFNPVSGPEDLAAALDAAEAFMTQQAVPLPVANRMMLALDEVISNALKSQKVVQPVRLVMRHNGCSLSATVIDSGIAFNPLEKENPQTDQALDQREEGGLGILLLRRLMDGIKYKRCKNFNVLHFSVNLP